MSAVNVSVTVKLRTKINIFVNVICQKIFQKHLFGSLNHITISTSKFHLNLVNIKLYNYTAFANLELWKHLIFYQLKKVLAKIGFCRGRKKYLT